MRARGLCQQDARMFTVLHANHLEDLRDLALKVIKAAPQPPLVPETFLVQSNGMAQ
ncbi:exodeoxyribonuclease V subunit gamma, partial [Cobetia marina]